MEQKLQFFVAGLGRFGQSVALTLDSMGYDVMAMDLDEEIVQDLSDKLGYVVCADAADEKNLASIGAGNADVAVIGIGDLSASLLTTLLLKELGVPKIVVKAVDELHGKMLSKIGADKIIYSEREMGIRVAHNLTNPGIADYIEMNNDITILTIVAPEDWIGKNLITLDVRRKFNINVVAVRRGEDTFINPRPDLDFEKGDQLVILGANESVKEATRKLE